MEARGTGWLPDPAPTAEEREASRLRFQPIGGAAIPDEGGITRDAWVLDQGASESCSAHLTAQMILALFGVKTSPYVPWWLAREADRPGVESLPNVGVSSYAMLRTMERHGAPPWEDWNPESPGFSYGRKPPALARIRGQRYKLDVTPVWDLVGAAAEPLCAALAIGQPVGIVVHADDRFKNPVNGYVLPEDNPDAPLHIVTGWWYRTMPDGAREIEIMNSWGPSYGDNGRAWLSPERIRSSPFLCIGRLP